MEIEQDINKFQDLDLQDKILINKKSKVKTRLNPNNKLRMSM